MYLTATICSLYVQPKAVTETDEKELAQKMEEMEKQNREVAGDDEDEIVGISGPVGLDDDGAGRSEAGAATGSASAAGKAEEDEEDGDDGDDQE